MAKVKNGGYEGYQDMLSQVDGAAVDRGARDKARKEADVSSANYEYQGKDNDWYCTVYFKSGDPFRINFYVWDATTPVMMAALEKDLGYPVVTTKETGGNGHYVAVLSRKVG